MKDISCLLGDHDWIYVDEEWRPTGNKNYERLWMFEECIDCPAKRWRPTHDTRAK